MSVISIGGPGDGFRVQIHGYSEILKSLKLNQDQRKNLQEFLEKEAKKIVKSAQQFVHKKTWRLHDSMRVLTGGATGKTVRVDVVCGGINVRGKFVDYAAAHHTINPYLEAAVMAHMDGFKDRLQDAIKWKWV